MATNPGGGALNLNVLISAQNTASAHGWIAA